MSYVIDALKRDLNDPNSPYYLGQPTTSEYIQNMLKGINTHYFGSNKKTFLAQPQSDMVQIMRNAKENNNKNNWLKTATAAVLGVAGIFLLKKVPIVSSILKIFK